MTYHTKEHPPLPFPEDYEVYYSDRLSTHPENGVYIGTHYPAAIWPEGELQLPFVTLTFEGESEIGIALLMTSHITHETIDLLSDRLTERVRLFENQQQIKFHQFAGIAKLGYELARGVSRRMGVDRFVPVDSGKKNWYEDRYSALGGSITSGEKNMYVDPLILGRVEGGNIALFDDAVFTGGSAVASVKALEAAGANQVIFFPVFTETRQWEQKFEQAGIDPFESVIPLGHLPTFSPLEDGSWMVDQDTL